MRPARSPRGDVQKFARSRAVFQSLFRAESLSRTSFKTEQPLPRDEKIPTPRERRRRARNFLFPRERLAKMLLMPKKLQNRRVVVTRPEEHNAGLRAELEARGAGVVEMPLIEISLDGDEAVADEIFSAIGEYDWLVFTSANGVRGFFKKFFERFKDLRWLGPCRIACVGPATKKAVEDLHLEVETVPDEHTGAALADKLIADHDLENLKVCLVTGNRNPDTLARRLSEEARAIVDAFPCYASDAADVSAHPALADFRANGADFIVFASGSAVRSFVMQAPTLQLEKSAVRPRAVAIGEPTASALRQAGIPAAAVAARATPEAIAEAIEALLD